ncbi:DNA glycosylase AlkZ-like family protein [Nocardioides sp.]|uniref:DNA glycosylase AlkZ-like family protein n=1 Tax=Nocardioides sp. TaxID=35761 RepID=UPI003D0D6BF7
MHQLSRVEARRIAVRAQLLDADRPTDLLDLVRHLGLLQLDPAAPIAPSADLVAWSRLGSAYSPDELRDALDSQALIDLEGLARPAEDLALFRADMDAWPGPEPLQSWQRELRDWVRANNACRLDILDRLRSDGPLPGSELPDTCVVPWRSSGWNNHRSTRMLLSLMVRRGEVAAAGGSGRERLWDLASRVHPDDPVVPADEARALRDQRRLRSLGIARVGGPQTQGEPNGVGGAGEPAVVEGVRGTWRVDPSQLDRDFAGRAALLSPFDRLVADRRRMDQLFDFDYQLEMFKPVAQRRWGYYALPILYDERLVGKLDAAADRADGVLRVRAVHQDEPFTEAMSADVGLEIRDLARWLGLELEGLQLT